MNNRHLAHPDLLSEFVRWQEQNMTGGWAVRWRRRPIWFAQIAQKLGLEREVSAPLFWGESMRVITNEVMSRSLLSFGYSEPTITALMLILLNRGDSMVDIGTHFAYEALLGCRLVGETGSIVGFEPNPQVFEMASRNLRGRPQARVEQKAIADFEGIASFQDRPISQSAFGGIGKEEGFGTFEVTVSRLDTQLAKRTQPVNFIKCDAEGSELAVLRGATGVLEKDRPFLVLEADMPTPEGIASARAHELADYLGKYGYKAFNFDFDGEFHFGDLDAFPVQHANIGFLPIERVDLLEIASQWTV